MDRLLTFPLSRSAGDHHYSKENVVLQLLAARAALISLIAITWVLAPSFGHAALYDGSWPARLVMLGCLAGTWCAWFGYAAARARN